MTSCSTSAWLVAAVLLAALAPSLAGEWCENFENGPGSFWTQPSSQGGKWEHTGYASENKQGHEVPRPSTGEDGILLLKPHAHGLVVWSMLVSPPMRFKAGATIELDYWLWFNRSQPNTPVSFMLFRRVEGIEDKEAFLNISSYANVYQSHWASIEAGLDLSRGNTFQVAVYGYMAGDGPVMSSDIGLDRIILRGVDGDNPCGGNTTVAPAPPPAPTSPMPPKPTGTPKYDFFCPTAYGLYIDPDNCHFFYQCFDWNAEHFECPADLVFNPIAKDCDYRKNVVGC
ncbi:uncharacterized protein LOC119113937 [Pollicipes pollicipes]|uniref:uncharacterized protein LOC119113937 n=1 Tax=Pollicipes pollicipes TaxID=41117 RepID=UPI0018858D25|nr:uncharacterized protein LOC119113937 [Pollicipes pollicipes]